MPTEKDRTRGSRHRVKHNIPSEYKKPCFYCVGSQTLEHVFEQEPGQPALDIPVWVEGLF